MREFATGRFTPLELDRSGAFAGGGSAVAPSSYDPAVLDDPILLAHGVGGRQDLPVPFSYALAGAVVTLAATFALLGVLWQEPRYAEEAGKSVGRPLPRTLATILDAPAFRIILRVIGLVATGYVALAAVFGRDDALNPTPYAVYILFWVGLPLASLVVGPVWRLLNPLRALHRGLAALMGSDPDEGLRPLPASLGYWPAAAGLFAFVWLELVAPDRATLPVLRTWFALYAGANLLAAAYFGARWFDRCDAFEAYSSVIARLAPIGRRSDGVLVVRNPLASLEATTPAPGLVAVVCVLLGSTAFDGFSNSTIWFRLSQDTPLPGTLVGTLGLLSFVAAAVATFSAAALLAGRLGHAQRRRLPQLFAHTVIPIVVGYVVAHYLSLLVFEGQRALILLSDPLGNGSNWLGTANRGVDFTLLTPTSIAVTQVLAVVLGHVVGVIAAHERAIRLFSRREALAGQIPLLAVMIGYTLAGLTLLFAG
jgi:hypothetical protein